MSAFRPAYDDTDVQGKARIPLNVERWRVCEAWFDESSRGGGYAFGGVENAAAITELLSQLQAASLLDQEFLERTIDLRGRIEVVLR